METKESEDSSENYEYIKKYIRDDNKSPKDKSFFSDSKFKMSRNGSNEVFNRIGESESHDNPTNYYKKHDSDYDESSKSVEKNESTSNPVVAAKKEFITGLEDESLTLDTCSRLTHDWGNK
jgi:hypothetical protein